MMAPITRRAALRGSAAAALGFAAEVAPALAALSPGAALIIAAEAMKALRAREIKAWSGLPEGWDDDDPAALAAARLSSDVAEAGEALAEMPATTAAGLAAKASATLALIPLDRIGADGAFLEHRSLIASVLHDAARIGMVS